MSTDQPTLSDFDTRDAHAEVLDDRGAAYWTTSDPEGFEAVAENCCRNCGSEIGSQVARVVGDNDGCVPACSECRHDVLDDHQLARGEYVETVRLVFFLREEADGSAVDNIGGESE